MPSVVPIHPVVKEESDEDDKRGRIGGEELLDASHAWPLHVIANQIGNTSLVTIHPVVN